MVAAQNDKPQSSDGQELTEQEMDALVDFYAILAEWAAEDEDRVQNGSRVIH